VCVCVCVCVYVLIQTDYSLSGIFVREFNAQCNGVVFSSDGQFLVVATYGTPLVQVLRASDRALVRSIGQGTLKIPSRLAISPDGTTVFVSDIKLHAVLQYRMDGTLVRQIGSKGQAAGKFDMPRGLVVSKAGELFVADRNNHRVQVFRVSDGTFLRQIGGAQGSGNGQFDTPVDVALSPDETVLLVVDLNNHRIQVFRARDGQYLRGWGSRGSADGRFDGPQSIVVTGSGEVVVADTYNHRMCVFDLNGTFRRSIGAGSGDNNGPGQLVKPFDVAYSSETNEVLIMQDGTDSTAVGGRERVSVFR
jgi:DNA-binding beta-propeller fold protein YncE